MNKQEKKDIREFARNLSLSADRLNKRTMPNESYNLALAMLKFACSTLITKINLLSANKCFVCKKDIKLKYNINVYGVNFHKNCFQKLPSSKFYKNENF